MRKGPVTCASSTKMMVEECVHLNHMCEPVKEIPPVPRSCTVWTSLDTGQEYLLVGDQMLWFGTQLDHSLINPNQIYGSTVLYFTHSLVIFRSLHVLRAVIVRDIVASRPGLLVYCIVDTVHTWIPYILHPMMSQHLAVLNYLQRCRIFHESE